MRSIAFCEIVSISSVKGIVIAMQYIDPIAGDIHINTLVATFHLVQSIRNLYLQSSHTKRTSKTRMVDNYSIAVNSGVNTPPQKWIPAFAGKTISFLSFAKQIMCLG